LLKRRTISSSPYPEIADEFKVSPEGPSLGQDVYADQPCSWRSIQVRTQLASKYAMETVWTIHNVISTESGAGHA
jgi:hypothetical protein